MNCFRGFKNKIEVDLKSRMTFYFGLTAMLAVVTVSLVLFFLVSSKLHKNLREQLASFAAVSAIAVDVQEHAKIRTKQDAQTETFKNLIFKLRKIKAGLPNVRYLYTLRINEKGEIVFVVDTDEDPNAAASVGEVYNAGGENLGNILPNLKVAYVNEDFHTDKWGTFLSAYAPIFTADGKREGFVGIDMTAGDVIALKRNFLFSIILVALIVIGVALYAGHRIGKRFTKPISKLVRESELIAKGDYSFKNTFLRQDEIGDLAVSMEKMCSSLKENEVHIKKQVEKLSHLLGNVNETSGQISHEADSVNSASQKFVTGASSQAESVRLISDSMNIITDQIKKGAESIKAITDASLSAKNSAVEGKTHIDGMGDSMNRISHSSSQISKIIKTIDEIAFQTNLLALNAAVEAARAGKHGKGFAIVAQEVRNLASKSASAAKETEALIKESVSEIEHGLVVSKQTGETFEKILTSFSAVASSLDGVSKMWQDQALGISQVGDEIKKIERVAKDHACIAKDTASFAEILQQTSNKLRLILKDS